MTDYPPEKVQALVDAALNWAEHTNRLSPEEIELNDALTALRPKEHVPRVGRAYVYENDERTGVVTDAYKAIELLPGHWLVDGDTGKAKRLEEGWVVLQRMPNHHDLLRHNAGWVSFHLSLLRVNFDE